MATYVLVHGGGHGGWCCRRVTRLLRSAGHEVYTPTMTGVGERAHLLRQGNDLDMHSLADPAVPYRLHVDTRLPETQLDEARSKGRL